MKSKHDREFEDTDWHKIFLKTLVLMKNLSPQSSLFNAHRSFAYLGDPF